MSQCTHRGQGITWGSCGAVTQAMSLGGSGLHPLSHLSAWLTSASAIASHCAKGSVICHRHCFPFLWERSPYHHNFVDKVQELFSSWITTTPRWRREPEHWRFSHSENSGRSARMWEGSGGNEAAQFPDIPPRQSIPAPTRLWLLFFRVSSLIKLDTLWLKHNLLSVRFPAPLWWNWILLLFPIVFFSLVMPRCIATECQVLDNSGYYEIKSEHQMYPYSYILTLSSSVLFFLLLDSFRVAWTTWNSLRSWRCPWAPDLPVSTSEMMEIQA